MLDFFPIPAAVGVGLLLLLLAILRRRRRLLYLGCFSVFWVYLLLLVNVTAFPIPIMAGGRPPSWWQATAFTLAHVNLVPFHYAGFTESHAITVEILRNIVLTVPFGFGVNFIARSWPKTVIRLALIVGSALELMQLLISLGIGGPYRTVDITDAILNAAGFLVGYAIFRLFARSYRARCTRSDASDDQVHSYLRAITDQARGRE